MKPFKSRCLVSSMLICPSMPRTAWFVAIVPQLLCFLFLKNISVWVIEHLGMLIINTSLVPPLVSYCPPGRENTAGFSRQFLVTSLLPEWELVLQSRGDVSFSLLPSHSLHHCLFPINSQLSYKVSFKYQWVPLPWGNIHYTTLWNFRCQPIFFQAALSKAVDSGCG